jgi:hypothetical protein
MLSTVVFQRGGGPARAPRDRVRCLQGLCSALR